MVEIGISEFTYGYAFLYEQTQAIWTDLKAAPVLPSLKQEEDEGWEARLPLVGVDFYYQFKLSDYLSRGNATYLKDNTYTGPYYRFWLHQRDNNRQHKRLRKHCLTNPYTYYVAPEFNSLEEFNNRFLTQQVTVNSRIIPLSQCADISDAQRHCITFQQGDPAWILHSESKRQEGSFTGRELETLYTRSKETWQPIDLRFAEQLLDKTRQVALKTLAEEEPTRARLARPIIDEPPMQHDRRHLLLRTADILSATLGVTLVLVGAAE